MLPLTLLFALQSAASGAAVGDGRDAVVEREAWAMGTRVTLRAEAEDTEPALRATEIVLAEVERLESLLSTWTDPTEIGRLNRAPVGESVALSEELHALLVDARGWARATGGAFEPAVGSLVDAWDLRGAGRVPCEGLLTRARSAAGPTVFELDPSRATATRLQADGWIDTGGFGKGAALRAAVDRLGREGLDEVRILADLGGQLWAGASAERPWTIPVAHPVDRGRPAAELRLHGVSVATSGGSERWVEVDGTRYGHILDPRSGRPAPAWGTVSVVHSDPMAADVLATALFVMGPEEGMRWLARHPDVAALFLDARRGVVEPRWTPAMDAWLVRIAQDPDLESIQGIDP